VREVQELLNFEFGTQQSSIEYSKVLFTVRMMLRRAGMVAGFASFAAAASNAVLRRQGSEGEARSILGGGLLGPAVALAQPDKAGSSADCEDPVCDDKKDLFLSSMGGMKRPRRKPECPLNRSQLGRSTWELLHTTAAYFPDEPSEDEKKAAKDLIEALGVIYACKHCREHFSEHLKEHPPDVSSRKSLSLWLCHTHNIVNEVVGKPQFPCSFEKLDNRWRSGCKKASDQQKPTESAQESLGQKVN